MTTTLPATRTAMTGGRPSRWALTMSLYLLGIFIGAIDTGIVTPARTVIQNELGVDNQVGIWMITMYTLAYAASIPVMGKLADRLGRKPVYLASIALFGIGSLLCGLSQDFNSFPMLIGARAIQAIGGGGILPIATAEIGTEVPQEKRGMALGLVGGVYGVANIFGASAGSLILDVAGAANWQWIFYVNVPIALAIVAGGVVILPNHRERATKPIDLLGILLLVTMILSLLYGVRSLDFFDLRASLASTDVWPYLVGFLALLPLFVLAERRAADPVLNLRYFTERGVALVLLISLLSGVILMAVVFVPQLAENALRIPSGDGGYFVIILGLASGVGAPLSGRLTDRFGPKVVLAVGGAGSLAAAAAVLFWLIPSPTQASVIASLALFGLGLGFVIGSPLNYMMLERTPTEESNSALATLSLVRSIGTTLAPAIMVGFIANAAGGLQDSLTAQLPQTITAPALPYAAELQQKLTDFKADERLAKELKGVDVPDLTAGSTIKVDVNGGGTLPDDLIELLQTADVTTITARSQIVARRMFEDKTPATVADIQNGVQAGIDGLTTADRKLVDQRADMTDTIATMTANLTKMDRTLATMRASLATMDAGAAKMAKGIRGMDAGIAGMRKAVAGLTKAVRGMDAGAGGLGKAVRGTDAGITGMKKAVRGMDAGIAGLRKAVAGMDRGLASQRAALAGLQAAPPNPGTAAQIARLKQSIRALEGQRATATGRLAATQARRQDTAAQLATLTIKRATASGKLKTLTGQRAATASQLSTLRKKLATTQRQRATLAAARAKLLTGRRELAEARSKLTTGRAELAGARTDLTTARTKVDGARAEIADTRHKMTVLRNAVPGAFDQALRGYLAEIDRRGPTLEATFQGALNDGFRGVYQLYAAACALLLLLLPLVPRARR